MTKFVFVVIVSSLGFSDEPRVDFPLPEIEVGPADSIVIGPELPDIHRLFCPKYYI